MSFWTDEQIQFLQQNLTLSSQERYRLYVARFGNIRTYEAVERHVRRIKSANQAQAIIYENLLDTDTEETVVTSVPDIQPNLNEERKTLLRESFGRVIRRNPLISSSREDFNTFIERLIEESSSVSPARSTPPSSGSSFCILLSDTHIGKQTDNFNKEIFVDRILSIPEKIQEEITLPDDLEEFVIMLAGDMLEGENIYETQAHHLEMPAIDQVQIAVDAFWNLAVKLYATFNCPVRFVTCPGNHGRVSKLASEKTNWDNIIYQTLGYLSQMNTESDISIDVNFESFVTFPVQDKTGMLFHHGTKHLGTPAMQSKVAGWLYTKNFEFMCFTPDTKVLDKLYRPVLIQDINSDMELASINALENIVKEQHPPRTVSEDIYRFKTIGLPPGLITGATSEHPFWVVKDNKEDWVEAKNIDVGDYLTIPVPSIPKDAINEPYKAKLLGFYLSEGSLENNRKKEPIGGVRWSFHKNETGLHQEISNLCKQVFGKETETYSYPGTEALQIAAHSPDIANFCLDNGGRYSDKKELSEWCFKLNSESRMELIRGWILGDASIRMGPGIDKIRSEVAGYTVSETLATQMYMLALSIGLHPFYRISEREGKKPAHIISFYGTHAQRITGIDPETTKTFSKTQIVNGLYRVKVLEIHKEYYEGAVYNMSTSTEQYIAGMVLTHNCHGHWHHWEVGTQFGKLVMKNGSLPGSDDLSERMGVFDPPRQGWLLVRKNQPINQLGFFEWSVEND